VQTLSMAKEIKYTDKSKGQPALVVLFQDIKETLRPFAQGNFKINADKPGYFEIYYKKEVEILGKSHPELLFVSLLIQKGYLGFYFFPIYIDQRLKDKIPPPLLSCLKGKTCFHLKKKDPLLLIQLEQVLQWGVDFYNSKGWT
jgi:hypothetical protein